jgi:hypothetical protein
MNVTQRGVLSSKLQRASFDVTVIPMEELTPDLFRQWIDSVIENWHDNFADE